jgi:hypothetical protein
MLGCWILRFNADSKSLNPSGGSARKFPFRKNEQGYRSCELLFQPLSCGTAALGGGRFLISGIRVYQW